MTSKELTILKFLSTQDSWVTSFSMSAFLDISVRTIKSYISSINSEFPNLIESSRNGYIVRDKKQLANVISSAKKVLYSPQTVIDRKKFILQKLLLETDRYDLDNLANELFISPATLTNELQKLKKELADYELTIKTKDNLVFIDGQETTKKKLISKLIYEDSKDSFLSINLMQSYLPHFDLTIVKQIVSDKLREHHYFMDDFSLLNLVLQIAITMERKLIRKTGKEVTGTDSWKSLVNAHIQEIVMDITEHIEKQFGMEFVDGEIYDFALLIMTRAISNSINDINMDQLSEFVGEDIIRLVSLIQTRTKETYNITIIRQDFTVRFALHIKNLLIRLKHNIVLRNPQVLDIKNSYPFIYDVSVFIANIITQEEGYVLTEDEISYIALHLGVLIEERKAIKHDVRAILVNPQYLNKSVDIANRLSSIFEDNLLITEIVSTQHELEAYSDYDLIITTIPFEVYPGKPYVQISAYLTNKDILSVSKKIEEVLKDRIKAKVKSKLEVMFKEELFFVDESFSDQNDAINVMADVLEKQGIVDSSFKEKLFERERVSSSAYMNIAMPHPLEMCARNSAIAVSIHPNAIMWNNNKVNIIFMLAINIRDSLFLKDIFDFITEVISEEKKLKTILDVKTYDDFIAALVSFAK
ncbi:PTS sugar transporter subunit IIA [Tepidanaerobacter sp. EBM-38]|uniref:BglG family transcription antiterminator n=1 Tax=Tepidanaerobacter sp. EBM-38 TaxID=1918496 RepID=UPI000A5F27CF|nr:PTS sugar transporter subunit IIA [Tepidanaerobacter sp. EBM-38]